MSEAARSLTGPEQAGEGRLTIAVVGDIHAGPAELPELEALMREIRAAADMLVLCGDLTHVGSTAEAEALATALSGFTKPIVAVLGNHDHESGTPELVEAALAPAGVRFLEAQTCTVEGVGFVGVKGFGGGFGSHMLASFGETPIKAFVSEAVEQALRLETALSGLDDRPVLVVLHYAPIAQTVMDEPPEIFPFLGSSRLAEVIDRFQNVAGIVHGHAHRGPFHGRTPGGHPVWNCAAHVAKDTGKAYALLRI